MIPEYFCIPTWFLNNIYSSDLLTYLAIIIASLTFMINSRMKYLSWINLIKSFKSELRAQKDWLQTAYQGPNRIREFYYPTKIVFKMTFESSREITRQGIDFINNIENGLSLNITRFNERIDAFNTILDYQNNTITADPVLSQKLIEKLGQINIDNGYLNYEEFVKILNKLNVANEEDKKLHYLAQQIYLINDILHTSIIGDGSNEYHLNYLFKVINQGLDKVIDTYRKYLPLYLKRYFIIITAVASLVMFIIIENIFRH